MRILVVLEEEHDDDVRPEEGHKEGSLAWPSEAKIAVAVRADICLVPEGPSTFEHHLDEGEDVNSDSCHKCRLVSEGAIAYKHQHEEHLNDYFRIEDISGDRHQYCAYRAFL